MPTAQLLRDIILTLMKVLFNTRLAFVIIVAVGIFAMAAHVVTDPDVWWHLKTGRLILQNHAVFKADPYSFTRTGQAWINHEWLSDVFMFSVYRVAGPAGLIVIFALVSSATFSVLLRRCAGEPYWAGALAVWGAIVAAPSWGVRPQTFTFLFASLLLLILERSYVRPNLLWGIPPLLLLWVNLHAGFALGIAFVFLFLAGDAFDYLIRHDESASDCRSFRRLGPLALICLAIIPMNPYGARMYWYPLQTLHSTTLQSYVSEWLSPNFHQGVYFPALALLLAIFIALAGSPLRLRVRDYLLLLVSTWAALQSARHVPIFALVAVPILSRLTYAWWDRKKTSFESESISHSAFRQAINVIALAAFLLFAVIKVRYVARDQNEAERRVFPAAAVEFLQTSNLAGPLFNSYNWGGYLIWKLYPNQRVFIDGRTDVYWERLLDDFGATYQLSSSSWQATLEKWKIETIVIPPDAPLSSALALLPEWRQVYHDSQAVIFRRAR